MAKFRLWICCVVYMFWPPAGAKLIQRMYAAETRGKELARKTRELVAEDRAGGRWVRSGVHRSRYRPKGAGGPAILKERDKLRWRAQ